MPCWRQTHNFSREWQCPRVSGQYWFIRMAELVWQIMSSSTSRMPINFATCKQSYQSSTKCVNLLLAKLFRGSIDMCFHFMLFLHIDMTQVVQILPQVRRKPTYSTHGCWCPGNTRNKGISNRDIGLVKPSELGSLTLRVNLFWCCFMDSYNWLVSMTHFSRIRGCLFKKYLYEW